MAKEWDSRTLPRNVLLKITMQQQKCINLNRKHLRLKFLIKNLTKNNIAWIQTNIMKVRSITSTFIILAESKVYGIVVKSFIQTYYMVCMATPTEKIGPKVILLFSESVAL